MSHWSIFFVNRTVYPEVLMIICKELLHQNLFFAIGRSNRMTFIICKQIVIQAHFFLNCCKNDKLWKYCCTSPSSMQQEVASGWSVSFAIAIWTRSVLFASGLSIRMIRMDQLQKHSCTGYPHCRKIYMNNPHLLQTMSHRNILFSARQPDLNLSKMIVVIFENQCLHLHQVWIVL